MYIHMESRKVGMINLSLKAAVETQTYRMDVWTQVGKERGGKN